MSHVRGRGVESWEKPRTRGFRWSFKKYISLVSEGRCEFTFVVKVRIRPFGTKAISAVESDRSEVVRKGCNNVRLPPSETNRMCQRAQKGGRLTQFALFDDRGGAL